MECFESAVPAIFLSYAPTFFIGEKKSLSRIRLFGDDLQLKLAFYVKYYNVSTLHHVRIVMGILTQVHGLRSSSVLTVFACLLRM